MTTGGPVGTADAGSPSAPPSCAHARWAGSVETLAAVWFPVKKPSWREMDIFLSGTLCGGQCQQQEPRRPSPPNTVGRKQPVSSATVQGDAVSGRRGTRAWPHVPGVCVSSWLRQQGTAERKAAGKCGSRPFSLEHLILYCLAAISVKGPGGAQLLRPGRGCIWGPR